MHKLKKSSKGHLIRFIVPVSPADNIFTRQAGRTTSLGLIMVATVASKLRGWRVEVIDEGNFRGPRNNRGLPDHEALQRKRPADVVGFYCGLSSTIERVWEIANFYRSEGAVTIAGGWHAHSCSEETLEHDIDIIVHGDGESVIEEILFALKYAGGEGLDKIFGISFLENGQMRTMISGLSFLQDGDRVSSNSGMREVKSLDDLPYPDFSLLRYAKVSTYPISRIRGCGMNCEFCSVKGNPRWSSGEHLFETVKHLVEKDRAGHFFLVDDRLEEDLPGAIEFFEMIAKEYGNRLSFIVQVRGEIAENLDFLRLMKRAGVEVVCVGVESDSKEELGVMRKAYNSSKVPGWIKTLRKYFRVHAMLMFNYPLREGSTLIGVEEMLNRLREFLRLAPPDTIQVLHPIPLAGTDLYQRLKKADRLFPPEVVSWRYYDGSFACFAPANMTIREFQEAPIKLMKEFYTFWSFFRILFYFFVPVRGFKNWQRSWWVEILKFGGWLSIRGWEKKHNIKAYIKRLEKYQSQGG